MTDICDTHAYWVRGSRYYREPRTLEIKAEQQRLYEQAQAVGAWEKSRRVPESERLTWYDTDFGSFVPKHITPEQLTARYNEITQNEANIMSEDIKLIRFVNSDGVELFKIPDGANIRVVYLPGDGRGIQTFPCKHLGSHHVRVNGNDYHIDEWASRMKAIGARYEPEVQLRGAEIVPISLGEEKFCTYNREDGNTCIGHISGEFGQSGNRFFSGWYNHTTRSEGDWTATTPEFQAELQSAVYALRQDLLKNHGSMLAFCQSRPEAKLPDSGDHEHYGFKLESESRQYFIRCFAAATSHESRFIIYAYADKPVLVLEQAQSDKPSVLKQIRDAEKAPKPPRKPKTLGKKKDGAEL